MSLKRVSIGYATSLVGILTSILNNLWLMRLVALEVEKADFGVYLLTVSVIAYIGLSQMGWTWPPLSESLKLLRGATRQPPIASTIN